MEMATREELERRRRDFDERGFGGDRIGWVGRGVESVEALGCSLDD